MTSNRGFVKMNVTEKKGEGTEGKNRMRALFLFSWQIDKNERLASLCPSRRFPAPLYGLLPVLYDYTSA